MSILLIAETSEEPGVATDKNMPTTTSLTAPVAPISTVSSVHVSGISPVPILACFVISYTILHISYQGSGPPYVDFHGFRIPEDCASHLVVIYGSHGDFMQGFRFGRSTREHFLKLLGSVMNDIEHNFVDIISAERIL
ncbi:hypothetical protein SO802_003362 [Lithocarpus litseifolius]|uniref:Uncharacterized protein n=1 Tax=Lithocarpus litseifolius TaxID=425828 RepID=A0AAW2E031_9ROSI